MLLKIKRKCIYGWFFYFKEKRHTSVCLYGWVECRSKAYKLNDSNIAKGDDGWSTAAII